MANQAYVLGDILGGRRLSNRGVNADAEWTLLSLETNAASTSRSPTDDWDGPRTRAVGERPVTFAEELRPGE